MLVVLQLMVSCLPSTKPTGRASQDDLVIEGGNINIETKSDGTGTAPDFSAAAAGDKTTVYSVLRDSKGKFIRLEPVIWDITSTAGNLSPASAPFTSVEIQFTGDGRDSLGNDTGTITASHSFFTADAESITVVAGTATNIFAETTEDGSGGELTDLTLNSAATTTIHGVTRDFFSNYVGTTSVTWSVTNGIGTFSVASGTSTVFTGTTIGSGIITASHASLAIDTTGTITIVSNAATKISIETKANGTGEVLTTTTAVSGTRLDLFAVTRDASDNYIGTASVTWTVTASVGTFVFGDVEAETFTFTGPGVGTITADHTTLTDFTTGNITATNTLPVPVSVTDTFFGDENAVAVFTITAGSDPDTNQSISYAVVSAPTNGTLSNCMDQAGAQNQLDRVCAFTPDANFSDSTTFTYRASDSFENSNETGTVTLFIKNNNFTWSNNALPLTSNRISRPGVYPVQSFPSTVGIPGAREGAGHWTDSTGKFYVFGGFGFDTNGIQGHLNDMWRFDPATRKWTYLTGSTTIDQGTVLSFSNTLGGTDLEVTPGSRRYSITWASSNSTGNDELFLFGGQGKTAASAYVQVLTTTFAGGETLSVNGVNFNYVAGPAIGENNFSSATTTAAVAINIASSINTSTNVLIASVVSAFADGSSSFVVITADTAGTGGNTIGLTEIDGGDDNFNLSGATLSGGNDDTTTNGYFNDLWRFNTVSGVWTLVKSHWGDPSFPLTQQNDPGTFGTINIATTTNFPSGRREANGHHIIQDGELFLFGGQGLDSISTDGMLNDLWKYNIASGIWTWVKGPNLVDGGGTYGTQLVADSANIPGARRGAAMWKDSTNTIYLFGGFGFPDAGGSGYLADTWSLNPTTLDWTHLHGPTTTNATGTYGSIDVLTDDNRPGSRNLSAFWTDNNDRLWLYGGFGKDTTNSSDRLADMWAYHTVLNQWIFMKGSSTGGERGVYNILNVESSTSLPGARFGASPFTDTSNNLWIFGGNGVDDIGGAGALHDLWLYNP